MTAAGQDLSRFHHIGVACRDLDQDTAGLRPLGYEPEGRDFEDPTQGVAGRFLRGPGPRLELLMDLPGRSVVAPWLRKGVRLYHLAWEERDIDVATRRLVAAGARVIVAPVPAVAFHGRRITFLILPNHQVIELIESPSLA